MAPGKFQLTAALCQIIVVRNAPNPHHFTGPAQLLVQLGVLDSDQTLCHREAIAGDLQTNFNYEIDPADISSGPGVSVSDCSASVENNAN